SIKKEILEKVDHLTVILKLFGVPKLYEVILKNGSYEIYRDSKNFSGEYINCFAERNDELGFEKVLNNFEGKYYAKTDTVRKYGEDLLIDGQTYLFFNDAGKRGDWNSILTYINNSDVLKKKFTFELLFHNKKLAKNIFSYSDDRYID
ncbi:hypothetical protein, partial [Tepidibacter mesophilus]